MKNFYAFAIFSFLALINIESEALTKKEAIDFFHLNKKHAITFLNVKGYQQTTDYTCGSAIVMSLMQYYGKLPTSELNPKTEMRIAKEMGTTVQEGTDEYQLVNWLNTHGFRALLPKHGTIDEIRKNLQKGIPVLIDWIDWGGHWVVMTGYDSAKKPHDISKDTIYFADSAAHFDNINTRDGITFINADRFLNMWFNSKHKKYIYIIAVPEDEKAASSQK